MVRRLFVYGTLSPDHAPASLADITAAMDLIGPASVRGTLFDFGTYPGAVLEGTKDRIDRIEGQVFTVPDDATIWQRLDDYEGLDPRQPWAGLFRREQCVATLHDGRDIECEVYVYNGLAEELRRVPSGRWRPRAEPR